MTAEEFKRAWERDDFELISFSAEAVAGLRIPEEQRAFLLQPGLPKQAAPYLDFGGKYNFEIPSVAEQWRAGEAFRRYRIIGANGFGDPVCLDEAADGAVVYLNHDDEMKRRFMNSNVQCLAFSLLAFRDVVRETLKSGGPDAWLDNNIPSEVVDQFILRMDEIDAAAIKADTFWFRSVLGEGI
jgi:hypothetical protein